MNPSDCHASAEPAASPVRTLVLKTLGVRRIAAWCEVSEGAVYQWLARGAPDAPIPPAYVPAIIAGARREGIEVEAGLLWPALAAVEAAA